MKKYLVEEFSGRYIAEETEKFPEVKEDKILDKWYFLSVIFADTEEEAIQKAKEMRK